MVGSPQFLFRQFWSQHKPSSPALPSGTAAPQGPQNSALSLSPPPLSMGYLSILSEPLIANAGSERTRKDSRTLEEAVPSPRDSASWGSPAPRIQPHGCPSPRDSASWASAAPGFNLMGCRMSGCFVYTRPHCLSRSSECLAVKPSRVFFATRTINIFKSSLPHLPPDGSFMNCLPGTHDGDDKSQKPQVSPTT